jgi:hypothetical protein
MNYKDTENSVAEDGVTELPGDDGFSLFCDRLDMDDMAIEFLWYEASLNVETENIKKLSKSLSEKEKHIKEVLAEQIANGYLFKDEFEKFLRDKYEEG